MTTDQDELAGLDLLLPMIFGGMQGQLLAVAAEIDLAERLRDGPKTPDQLAAATHTDVHALGRVLRALATLGVVRGDDKAGYECTPAGRLLRRDSACSMHHYAIMNNRDWLVRIGPHLFDSLRSGREAFESVHHESCYQYLVNHPADASVFNAALTELSRQDALAIAEACDFSGVRRLVDLGGGEGLLVAELLEANPDLTAVLLDLPEVVSGAVDRLQPHIRTGRCEIVGADFREGVPGEGDIYVLKRVVSTCSREDIATALGHVRVTIPAQGRLLIADPDPGSRYGALLDVLMLVATGGGLPTEAEIGDLLSDAGFRLERSRVTPTRLRISEAVPA